jgi:hypothetical protein
LAQEHCRKRTTFQPLASQPVTLRALGRGRWRYQGCRTRYLKTDYLRIIRRIRFHAVIQAPQSSELPADWLDAQVRLRGVCWTDVDRENKPAGFTLYLPGTNTMSMLTAGSSNTFSLPLLSDSQRIELHYQSDRRVKFSGTVLFHSPAGEVFFTDRAGPIQARLLAPLAKASPNGVYFDRPAIKPLSPGTQIELVGAPKDTAFAHPFCRTPNFASLVKVARHRMWKSHHVKRYRDVTTGLWSP